MYNDVLNFQKPLKAMTKKFEPNFKKKLMDIDFKFEGLNEDIIASYYWIFNFPYYIGKGYQTIKLEDYHYFSENNQFGAGIRQQKGGTIRAFQENLTQLVTLVKQHMFPLLKEVKQTHFYKKWVNDIVENDTIVQKVLKKYREKDAKKTLSELRGHLRSGNKVEDFDSENFERILALRDEAIRHFKDKWVTEVDGGKMWQLNKSASEQGLDFIHLPHLFFGTNLEDPFQQNENLKEQLDKTVYEVDITTTAKSQIAGFMYRFYTWLPTAVRDIDISFKIKKSSLKQFYAQLQMYMEFMKPLLIEISKKSEGLDQGNFFKGYEMENHEIANLLDVSQTFIRTIGMRGYTRLKTPGTMEQIDSWTQNGFFISNPNFIWSGKAFDKESEKGKFGFITEVDDDNYKFVEYGANSEDEIRKAKQLSKKQFNKYVKDNPDKCYDVSKKDICYFPICELVFKQKRRSYQQQTQQGLQQVPYIQNWIRFLAHSWNIVEISAYREKLKIQNLEVLETFIGELGAVKEELLMYVNDLEDDNMDEESEKKEEKSSDKKKEKTKTDTTLLLGPFAGLGSMFKPFIPDLNFKSSGGNSSNKKEHPKKNDILESELMAQEDVWKIYNIYKVVHGFIKW